MHIAIEQMLHFHLGREFPEYPREMVGPACREFTADASLFCADLRAKFPSTGDDTTILEDAPRLMQADIATFAVFLYRLERQLFLANPDNALLPLLSSLMRIRSGAEMYYSTDIGPGLNVQHGVGIVIGPRNVIGRNFMIHQGVTIGQQRAWSPNEKVVIGNDVILFAGSKVFGNIAIGDNVWVGANAVVVQSLDSNGVYAGIPARRIRDLPPKRV
ncbi:MAG: hypothetical protein AB1413_03835 [Thermodesulfobacteriota bacterium]